MSQCQANGDDLLAGQFDHRLERVWRPVYCRISMSASDLEIQQNPGLDSMVLYRCLLALLSTLLSTLLSAQTHEDAQRPRRSGWLELSA
jgi:hypothetical protein